MSLWLALVVIVLIVTAGNVLMERSGRRSLPGSAPEGEVRELRERLEQLSSQVERLSEEQRFLTRLLEGRPERPNDAAPRDGEPEGTSEWSRARTSKAT